jgi:GST-like protein
MRLHRRPGWGSAIIELQFACYGIDCELIEVGDIYADPEARRRLAEINPLEQVPVLELDTGEVMTESAAMTLYLADLTGSDLLVPGPQAVERAAFLRWLIHMVAAVYPVFFYGDVPTRFVDDAQAAKGFAEILGSYHKRLWRGIEAEVATGGGPWFLGQRFSALDLYLAVMAQWRPGKDWFAAEAPHVAAIAAAVARRPDCAAVWRRNFP